MRMLPITLMVTAIHPKPTQLLHIALPFVC